MLEVFRVQRDFLLASTGHQDPNIPLTGTGPEQALKIREIKEMATAQKDGRFDFYSKWEVAISMFLRHSRHSFCSN